MYGYDSSNLPHLATYAEAHKFWERADTWRNKDERILDSRRKPNITIRKTSDGSIACKLYNTDVVTYKPDGSLQLKPWASVSTDSFARPLLLHTNVYPHFNRGIVQIADKFYRSTNITLTLVDGPSYRLVSEPEEFTLYYINKKASAEVMNAHDYKAFCTWVKMVAASGIEYTPTGRFYIDTVSAKLVDRTKWPELLVFCGYRQYSQPYIVRAVDVQATIKRVRTKLYSEHPQVFDAERQPFLTTEQEVARWKKGRNI